MIEYHPHCEDANCDLGMLRYDCPVCKRNVDDYGGAAIQYPGHLDPIPTECPECGAKLILDNNEVRIG